jgi:hypothetical protein
MIAHERVGLTRIRRNFEIRGKYFSLFRVQDPRSTSARPAITRRNTLRTHKGVGEGAGRRILFASGRSSWR